jgi:hypothetical protein
MTTVMPNVNHHGGPTDACSVAAIILAPSEDGAPDGGPCPTTVVDGLGCFGSGLLRFDRRRSTEAKVAEVPPLDFHDGGDVHDLGLQVLDTLRIPVQLSGHDFEEPVLLVLRVENLHDRCSEPCDGVTSRGRTILRARLGGRAIVVGSGAGRPARLGRFPAEVIRSSIGRVGLVFGRLLRQVGHEDANEVHEGALSLGLPRTEGLHEGPGEIPSLLVEADAAPNVCHEGSLHLVDGSLNLGTEFHFFGSCECFSALGHDVSPKERPGNSGWSCAAKQAAARMPSQAQQFKLFRFNGLAPNGRAYGRVRKNYTAVAKRYTRI